MNCPHPFCSTCRMMQDHKTEDGFKRRSQGQRKRERWKKRLQARGEWIEKPKTTTTTERGIETK